MEVSAVMLREEEQHVQELPKLLMDKIVQTKGAFAKGVVEWR